MPKGQLRPGLRKVWGVVSDDAYAELVRFQAERGLPNLCQTVGAAIGEWAQTRRNGVLNPSEEPETAGRV
jgi:hypothetical protein